MTDQPTVTDLNETAVSDLKINEPTVSKIDVSDLDAIHEGAFEGGSELPDPETCADEAWVNPESGQAYVSDGEEWLQYPSLGTFFCLIYDREFKRGVESFQPF